MLRRPATSASVTLAITALCFVAAAVAMALFAPRLYGREETGLLNAPYMVAHYGKSAFPVYGYWYTAAYDKLFVHFPTHYTQIGYLWSLGIPLHYAEALVPLALVVVVIGLAVTLPVAAVARLGLLLGFGSGLAAVVSIGSEDYAFHLRPDLHMAIAWVAGLLLCEHARLRGWPRSWVFAASMAMVYASAIHYSGIVAGTGLIAYAVASWRAVDTRRFVQLVAAAIAGGAVVAVPFVTLFLWRNWGEIQYVTSANSATGGWLWTLTQNFTIYPGAVDEIRSAGPFSLLPARILEWCFAWSVPPFVIATLILVAIRPTRVVAAAALPMPLFLYLVSRRKLLSYLYPEMFLLSIAFWILIALAVGWQSRRVRWRPLLHPLLAAAVVGLVLTTTPALRQVRAARPEPHELTVARAIGRRIVGPNATVAAQHGAWYVAGAARWFDPTNDLLWTVPELDQATYWRQFDAVTAISDSHSATNTGRNEATLLRDGLVHPIGFYSTRRSGLSGWVWTSARPERPFRGYFWRGDELVEFQSRAAGGRYVVVSGMTRAAEATEPRAQVERLRRALPVVADATLWLPSSTPRFEMLYILVLDAQRTIAPPEEVTLRELARGEIARVDVDDLIAEPDERIAFPRTAAEAFAAHARPMEPARPVTWVPQMSPERGKGAITVGTTVRAALPIAADDYLVKTEPVPVVPRSHYLVSYELQLNTGRSALYVMPGDGTQLLIGFRREVNQPWTAERFVLYTGERTAVRFLLAAANSYGPGALDVGLRNVKVQRAELIR